MCVSGGTLSSVAMLLALAGPWDSVLVMSMKQLLTVKEHLTADAAHFRSCGEKPQSPFTTQSSRAELDASKECNQEQATLYQNLVGVLRWIIELGRVDVNTGVGPPCLSSCWTFTSSIACFPLSRSS